MLSTPYNLFQHHHANTDCPSQHAHAITTVYTLGNSDKKEDLYRLLKDIRDGIDISYTSDYANFLQHLFVPLLDVIRKTQPQMVANDIQQQRVITLEILHRIPCASDVR